MTLRRDLRFLGLILVLCLLTGTAVNYLDAEAAGPGIRGGPVWDKPWVVVAEARKLPERVELVSLGEFVATAYCSCPKCCGQWSAYNRTASGTTPEEGRTIAADWSVLPVGTEVYIPSLGWRVVEDTGAGIAADRLDVYFADHREAVEFGVQTVEVWAYDLKGGEWDEHDLHGQKERAGVGSRGSDAPGDAGGGQQRRYVVGRYQKGPVGRAGTGMKKAALRCTRPESGKDSSSLRSSE